MTTTTYSVSGFDGVEMCAGIREWSKAMEIARKHAAERGFASVYAVGGAEDGDSWDVEATTIENITTAQIRTLADEAVACGDHAMADICAIALAAHETADAEGNDLVGPDGKVWTRTQARQSVVRAIRDAEAQG